ncbi:MAG: ABC transporter permease [Muribaculaceae bacterium]|nr:ABC transporter permease [Muribaculaceae bacterium]
MKTESWLASRLSLRRGVAASTSTGAVIAVAGVAITVTVMLLTLAIVAGFKNQIEQKVMGFEPSVAILPPYHPDTGVSENLMQADSSLVEIVSTTVPTANVVTEIRRYGILKTDSDFLAVQFTGRGESHDDSFERANMREGNWPNYTDQEKRNSIVISTEMASRLGVEPGDEIFTYFFSDGAVKTRRVTIEGLYRSYFGEYDATVAYASADMLSGLSSADTVLCTAISLEGIDRRHIAETSSRLQGAMIEAYQKGSLDNLYPVTDVLRTGAVFFNWLDLLDTNVAVIFILMACVAGFTLISSLFILILDRVRTIGVLMALGMSPGGISRIFVLMALRLTGLGMLIGNALGLGLIFAQAHWHFIPLNPEMYYLPYVPMELSATAFVCLNIAVAAGAWLILILPARLAARTSPAEAMRFE